MSSEDPSDLVMGKATSLKPETPVTAPPALFEHCINTYEAMLDESFEVEEGATKGIVVYEGFLTSLITGEKLNLSVPYYSHVSKALQRMGCIRQLRRGGGSSPSQWELLKEPTLEAFMSAQPPKQPRQTKKDATDQQIRALTQRVADLESFQEQTIEFLSKKFGSEEKKDD